MINNALRAIILAMFAVATLYPLHILSFTAVKFIEIGICVFAYLLSKVLHAKKG